VTATTAPAKKSPKTSPENIKRIDEMFDKMANLVQQLACRWADEHEYEDIGEYRERLQREMPEGFSIVKMTKRPFGFHFKIGTDATYAVSCTSRQYCWTRVA